MSETTYYVLKNIEDTDFTNLEDNEYKTHYVDELFDGRLLVTIYEDKGEYTTVSKECYPCTQWYKIISK